MEINQASQPASKEEQLFGVICSLKENASLNEQYTWAEKIVSYDKSLFSTGKPRKYFKSIEALVSGISTKLTLSRPVVTAELQKHTSSAPFVVGGVALLCGGAQWYGKARLNYWGISGLAFISGALSTVSVMSLLKQRRIVTKLRTSEKMLDALQAKVDAWLTQRIELQDYNESEDGESGEDASEGQESVDGESD